MKKVTQTEFDNNFNEYDNSDESYENTRMNERSRSRQHQYGGSHNFNFSEIQNRIFLNITINNTKRTRPTKTLRKIKLAFFNVFFKNSKW